MTAGSTPAGKWTDASLDQMRTIGDPLADGVVAELFESGGVYRVWEVMKTLVQNDHPAPEQLPAQMRDYLAAAEVPHVDDSLILGGQRLFERCGVEILMVLACYSLPASYSARRGVQVLYRTGYLNNRPNHRLFETTQMVMDVLVPGGLSPDGRGVRTAQKIRLLHAATRRLILTDPERAWSDELGLPINQEDLAGTLMVFTYIIMDGLAKLGITAAPEEQQGYLEVWKVISRIMGIREELIPATMPDAKELCDTIQRRQVEPCPEGKAMNDALLQMMEHVMPPGPWRKWPAALMRHFLPPDVADHFGLPHYDFQEHILEDAARFRSELDTKGGHIPPKLWLMRKFGLLFMESVVKLELGGKRTPFIIPTSLHHGWAQAHMAAAADPPRK
ncbi:MAG TPA: oxygenase MpaB family protein [Bryobacteraceae bacterium]|nr:oxygenase MpaB family protein [Bryobacteraceae bacterium]